MTTACIEHVNVTVKNADQLAALFCKLFDWKVHWSGPSKDQGYSVHVGSENRYLALYSHPSTSDETHSYFTHGTLNHIGVVVNDLDAMERLVHSNGFEPNNHRNYGVCKSFYFMAEERLEIEVVSYLEKESQ